jgi:SOS-response transcriptional repressor LexA/DNA-binding XRE family transcriptional regulator
MEDSPESVPHPSRLPSEQELSSALVDIGEQIKRFREKLGLKRLPAARRAGVSVKHLADIERGANVSLKIVMRIIWTFGMTALSVGQLDLLAVDRPPLQSAGPLEDALADAADRLEDALELVTGGRRTGRLFMKARSNDDKGASAAVVSIRPTASVSQPGNREARLPSGLKVVRENVGRITVSLAGIVSAGLPITSSKDDDSVMVPEFALDREEVVVRVSGDGFVEWGITDGELLIVDRRNRAATGELVLALHNGGAVIGRYWNKHGERRVIAADSSHAVTVAPDDPFEIYGVVNTTMRPR